MSNIFNAYDEADKTVRAARNEIPEVTAEEFAKEYRKLYDMSRHIKGITSVSFDLTYKGSSSATELIKALVEYEMAESNKMRLLHKEEA